MAKIPAQSMRSEAKAFRLLTFVETKVDESGVDLSRKTLRPGDESATKVRS